MLPLKQQLTIGCSRGRVERRGWGEGVTPHRFFQNFEKRVSFLMLKVSVAVQKSFSKDLMCQLFLQVICHYHSNHVFTCMSSQISSFLIEFFVFFQFSWAALQNSNCFTSLWINLIRYFLILWENNENQDGVSKMK